MYLKEYIRCDGLCLAELIRRGEISEQEAVASARQAIRVVNPTINAVIEEFAEPLAAEQSETAPFRGVPFLIKDLALHAKGILNECGSRLARGMRFDHDTELMRRFRAAGLRTIGRLSTPEFGFCTTTEPLTNGPTRNPWDPGRSPGGSSGASAAAVASGIVPMAHANDGGGSIRIPAACCGLVGLKPTRGRVSPGPDTGEALNGLGIEFAVTRTVRDAAALLDAVQGRAVGDPYVIAPPASSYREAITMAPRTLRIACETSAWSGVEVDPELRAAVANTAALCEASGHEVVDSQLTIDWEGFLDATTVIWTVNIASWIDSLAAATGRKQGESNLEATTHACYRYGKAVTAERLAGALSAANALSRTIGALFEDIDLLLTPTAARPAVPIGEINANDPALDAAAWSAHLFGPCPFTPIFNTTGQPAISLPLHRTAAKLPLGVQFVGRQGDETTLLQLARQFERMLPWPPIAPLAEELSG